MSKVLISRIPGGIMEKELLTLKEIAIKLGLPESTLRKYRDTYPQFIPYVGSGRDRRYKEDAIEVFKAIRDFRDEQHLSWDDTERELAAKFPINADAVGKKAAVSEEETNIFFERLERAVKQITSNSERQEFVASALANEIIGIRKLLEVMSPMAEEIQNIRKTSYGYNEVVQRQYKENQKNVVQLYQAIATMEANTRGAAKDIAAEVVPMIEAALSKAGPALAPVIEASADPAVVVRLREELKVKEVEVEKFRDLYVRAKREVERLREELKKKTLDELYGQKQEVPSAGAPPPLGSAKDKSGVKGGKLFFKAKKK